jgi:hypothetical protein
VLTVRLRFWANGQRLCRANEPAATRVGLSRRRQHEEPRGFPAHTRCADISQILAEEIAAARSLFVREGTYGKQGRSEASYMSRTEVLRLVRECIAEYLASTEEAECKR